MKTIRIKKTAIQIYYIKVLKQYIIDIVKNNRIIESNKANTIIEAKKIVSDMIENLGLFDYSLTF